MSLATRWATLMDSLGRYAVVGLAFALPISTALANIFFALVIVFWLAGGQYRHKLSYFVKSPISFAALLLFLWLVISLFWVDEFGSNQWHFLLKYSELIAITIILWYLLDPTYRLKVLAGFAVAILITLVLSYAAYFKLLPPMDWLKAAPGNAVVFKLHITHSLLMALAVLLFSLYAVKAWSKRQRIIAICWAIAFFLALVNVLFMVQGRTGYVVLAAFVMLVFGLRAGWRGLLVASLIIFFAGIASYQVSKTMRERVDLGLSELSQWRSHIPSDTSVGMRLEFATNSLELISRRPIVGHGLGSFPAEYSNLVEGTGKVQTQNPHNDFLLLAVQGGVTAVLLYLYLLFRLCMSARLMPSLEERILTPAIAIWIGVGGIFNALLIDHTERLLFTLLVGLLAAATITPLIPRGQNLNVK